MKFTGNGTTGWELVGSAGFSADYAPYISLALDASGTPYVAYEDGGNGYHASVMKFTGNGTTGWELVGSAGFSANIADYTSLALDASGTPYVAYQDYGNLNKASVMKFTGNGDTGWEAVGLPGFSAGVANYTSLALDASGTPYVAYQDYGNSNKASVMKFNGSSWVNVGSAGFSTDEAYLPSLALDASGAPYVAYSDNANSGKASVMKYAAASTAKDITAFSFTNPAATGVINGTDIAVTVPFGTNVTALVPTITHSGVSISPNSGVAQNFTSPVTYTVTAADGTTKDYTVTVTRANYKLFLPLLLR